MINNVGLNSGAHYSAALELMPRRLRRIFTMGRHDLTFPLTHPQEVREYAEYQKRMFLLYAWDHPWRKVQYSLEELWLNLRHGNISNITHAIANRIGIMLHGTRHV